MPGSPQRIVEHCYRIRLGFVNAYVITRPDELTIIDCGMSGNVKKLAAAISRLGCDIKQTKHILITHCHPDHAGSLAELQHQCPAATTHMHALDAACVRQGISLPPDRPLKPSPGLHNQLLYQCFIARANPAIPAARVDRLVYDGQRLAIAGGISVIHAPGHSAGQVCYLWHSDQGILFAGDVAASIFGPSYSIAYEDFELGKQTLCELSTHAFEAICFGHGRPILRAANRELGKAFQPKPAGRLVPATQGPITRKRD